MLFKLLPIVTLALSINEALADVKFKGVNIAGFDFGCVINVSFFLYTFFLKLTCVGDLYSYRYETSSSELGEVVIAKAPNEKQLLC